LAEVLTPEEHSLLERTLVPKIGSAGHCIGFHLGLTIYKGERKSGGADSTIDALQVYKRWRDVVKGYLRGPASLPNGGSPNGGSTGDRIYTKCVRHKTESYNASISQIQSYDTDRKASVSQILSLDTKFVKAFLHEQ
jgi:hypothetical protein